MLPAHRVEAVLTQDGKLSLDHLPFRAGEAVEVIVIASPRAQTAGPLAGSVLKYDRPTEPVADGDWDALK